MIRPVHFVLVSLALILSLGLLPPATAVADDSEPGTHTILRLRVGLAYPDAPRSSGAGWLAGGSIGVAVGQHALVALAYDHIDLAPAGAADLSLDPLTVQFEVGAPVRKSPSPHISVGAGFYFREDRTKYRTILPQSPLEQNERFAASPQSRSFGMNLGGGVSIPFANRLAADLGLRYHQVMEAPRSAVGTVDFGLSYVLR